MMGRFNPLAPASGSNSQNQNTRAPAPPPETKSSDKPMSISSIASMATMGKSMTKSLGAGLHNVAQATSLPNPLNNNAEIEKKTKQAATEKKIQIAQVLTILEDIHLQCPPSHSGIILAYTGPSCMPVINPGIRFTWFRMSGEDRVEQVDESTKPWYAPTVDDVGAVICAQCEDNYYQGCSRYIECGPIKADALLCSQADSVIENGIYETQGVCVSLGLMQAPHSISAGDVHGTDDVRDSFSANGPGAQAYSAQQLDPTSSSNNSNGQSFTTVLSKKVAFLQLDGRSTVEVDEHGIFISIPTMDNSVNNTDKKASAGQAGKKRDNQSNASASLRSKFKAPRRGLRIPGSTGLKATCAQPLSLVLSVPIKREDDQSESEFNSDGTSGLDDTSEEARMRRFLSSSTVSIPWTYEGHNHSAEAYVVNDPNLSFEEKQEVLREAERDAVIFANTVCALAEFISCLPEGTDEICLCFSCPDRLVRDSLVLSIRGLAAMPSSCTRYERKAVFPWLMHAGEDQLVAESTENETQETKRLLKAKEEENLVLKRERNELTVQLLESREELVGAKQRMIQMQNAAAKQQQQQTGGDKRASGNFNGATTKKSSTDDPFSGFGAAAAAPADPNVALAELGKAEAFKQLSSKIIELENKLSIASKREAEFTKTRSDIEARNTVLNTDLSKSQKNCEDISRKLASLQSLSDAKTQSIVLLEKDQEHNKSVIMTMEMRLKEMEVLRAKLEKTEATLLETQNSLETALADGENYRSMIGHQAGEISIMKDAAIEAQRVSADAITHLEKELGDSIVQNRQYETEIEALLLVVADRDRLLQELSEAHSEKDRLAGEINALQQKSESQARDLKKHIKDSSSAITEFEKALVRKSEECNELYVRVNQWEKAEEERLAQESNSLSNRMMRRISSIHLPDGVLGDHSINGSSIGGGGGAAGSNSNNNNHSSHSQGKGSSSRPVSVNAASAASTTTCANSGAAGMSGMFRGIGASAKRMSGTGAERSSP